MPIPIKPIKDESENGDFLDYSFLSNQISNQSNKLKTVASSKDAEILMKIWLEAENSNDGFKLTENLGLDTKDVSRLKSFGLLSGSSSEVKFTERAKKIITVMALGEGNKLEKGRIDKSYIEILASMDKKGKKGYRIPKFASSSSNNLRVK